tara:strand:- start:173 stop:538 length:366 start_codon:yes stop_codon:yes gene_type:complete
MNKLEILIQGRIEDLTCSTESQKWKQMAFADTSQERDEYCWRSAMENMDKGISIREFSRKLVGEKFVNRNDTSDAVLFDPRVTLALVLWSEEHTKAKEIKEKWLESADLRLIGRSLLEEEA